MNENDKIILEQILDAQRLEHAPSASKSEFFQMFVAEQTLKDHDLGYDELEAGIVDGGNDGGIDAMYVLVSRASQALYLSDAVAHAHLGVDERLIGLRGVHGRRLCAEGALEPCDRLARPGVGDDGERAVQGGHPGHRCLLARR